MGRRKPKKCCYCGKRAVRLRSYCKTCLARLRYYGVVDTPSFPTQAEARRLRFVMGEV